MSVLPEFIDHGIQSCLSATNNADGAAAVIHNCNTEPVANFSISNFSTAPTPQQITTFGNKCLDVTNGVNANGVKLQWWTCGTNNPNQQWIFAPEGLDSVLQWSNTNKCVDITNGITTDGNQLQIWECSSNNPNQGWDPASIPFNTIGPLHIEAPLTETPPGDPWCIVAQDSINGSPVFLNPCANFTSQFPSGNITFTIPVPSLAGPIKTFSGSKCLDVPNGNTTNGVKLQVWDCVEGNTNQLFIESQVRIAWANKNKCLDLTNGVFTLGAPIQIWDCIDGNPNQNWGTSQVTN